MNRKERRIKQSQETLHYRDKAYTVEEAGALAVKEQGLQHLAAAVELYDLILARIPHYAEAHNNRGVALKDMRRYEEALASFDKAIALKPDNAEAYTNQGVVLQELGRYVLALASYDKALELNSARAETWNNRGAVLQKMHRFEEAVKSYDSALALKPDYSEAHNNRGAALHAMGRYEDALIAVAQAIAFRPWYAEAYNNQGNILLNFKKYHAALTSYDNAIAINADYAETHNNRGVTLMEMGRLEEALASCERALALKPDYAQAHNSRGSILQKLKRYDEALMSCDRAIALNPDYAGAWQNRGLILVNKGDMHEAERMFRKASVLKPGFPDPLSSLVHIRTYEDPEHPDVQAIRALLGKPGISVDDREYLAFALAKIYDDCSRYEDAFAFYRMANDLRGNAVSYDTAKVERLTQSIRENFSSTVVPFNAASQDRAPIFIVGMPRSGTTLMANILSNHPAVISAGELPTLADLITGLSLGKDALYPEAARCITSAQAQEFAETYLKRLKRDARPDITYIIDKHPLNFRYLGLIAMLFPRAHVIHCTRHPLDTLLSNYFQRFTVHYDYAFDLDHIAHFQREYEKIMAHWRKVLPAGMMLEVRYEDMVTETEQVARRTLEFLHLPWDTRCLAPHTNPGPVETASQWQVRQPIYRQSLDRWRHYEIHLARFREMSGKKE